mgnify:CR=1 FL=1
MNLIELEREIKKYKIVENLKDGVADGLLRGERDESKSHHYYNLGYDFGVHLYGELKIEENSE